MKKVLMSGDEAIARGAYEAGVSCGFGYRTPSTEVLEAFSQYDVYAEWSINEKWRGSGNRRLVRRCKGACHNETRGA